jgi:hypothetical protein
MDKPSASRTRAELKRDYKESPPAAGVYAVRNKENGKVLVGAAMNMQGALNRWRFELSNGSHQKYPGLQEDWNRHGAGAFSFEVLDTLERSKDPGVDPAEELKVLEALWLDRLQPYGDKGYNVRP